MTDFLQDNMSLGFPSIFMSEDSNSSAFEMPSTGIEAADLSSLLSQFEEASQSLDGVSTPPEKEPIPEVPTPPVVKSKPDQLKAQSKSPVVTPPATPPPEVLARIRAKRKRKLAILLPDLPAKLKAKSTGNLTGNKVTCPETNNNQTKAEVNPVDADVSTDYYNHIPDHDYCVNSPKMSPKSDKSDCFMSALMDPVPEAAQVCEVLTMKDEVVIDAGDTSGLNSDIQQELEDGEVPESPVLLVDPSKNRSLKATPVRKEKSNPSKAKDKTRRVYRKREESPVQDGDRYFDKIPAYFTTLSKPLKPPTKDKVSDQPSGIRREDFIERDTSPKRHESGVFDKLPAYYSCFTNSTRYDNRDENEDKYDLDDLDSYPCAKKPRKYRSVSRSRSRSYSRSRSRSYSRSRSRHRSRHRRRSYSSDSGSSSSSRSRSRSRSYSRSRSRSRSSSRRSRSYSHSRSYRSYSRSRSRGRSPSRSPSRYSSRYSSRSRSRSRSQSAERRRQERKERKEKEKARQIEERRIVYVGKIPDGYTRRELRKRFDRFGDIEEVSVHFREYGDNYGFVTFSYTCDAYAAIEKGNEIPGEKKFDLCFGGRRQFCDTGYADLDGNAEYEEELAPLPSSGSLDFDQLLKQARQQQKRRR